MEYYDRVKGSESPVRQRRAAWETSAQSGSCLQRRGDEKTGVVVIHIIEIENLENSALLPYTHLNENQLRHYYEPRLGLFVGESRTVVERALDAGYEPESLLLESRYLETEGRGILQRLEALPSEIPVYTAELEVLSEIAGYHLTRGILCAFRRKPLPSVRQVCEGARRIAVLENIENPTNVGAVIRSAAALHMDAVLMTPTSADPLYRRAIRVSVGTVFQIPWTYIGLQEEGMDLLHEMGFRTAAMALQNDTVAIDDPRLLQEEKLAIVLGNEGDGLLASTVAACDYTVKIPMSHGVDSLNVAAASAVAFWQLGRPTGAE